MPADRSRARERARQPRRPLRRDDRPGRHRRRKRAREPGALEEDEDKRPTVQIGDPFTGKKLIEASLELVEGGLVESLQDCGAAGLASSLAEMASKGGAGVDVQLDRVPLREDGMEPWEIMISESQERMIASAPQTAMTTSRQSARSGSSPAR